MPFSVSGFPEVVYLFPLHLFPLPLPNRTLPTPRQFCINTFPLRLQQSKKFPGPMLLVIVTAVAAVCPRRSPLACHCRRGGLNRYPPPSYSRCRCRLHQSLLSSLGARAPGNRSEHLRNIEGRGTIYLAHSHQEHFMPILNVT